MAFSSDTKIMTSKGWKYIADISGKDKVLVRNFIGDAEFIQPFALKKSHYEGEVIQFGGAYWAVTLTPNHKVVYDTVPDGVRATQSIIEARDVMVDKHKHLYRKFRYIREEKSDDYIIVADRRVSISDQDWYTIVAYTVAKGYISKDSNPRLKFFIGFEHLLPIVSILEAKGISYLYTPGTQVLTVNRNNTLARKLKKFLGARARRDMKLPDKMIYGSSQALMKHFINTVTDILAKPSQKRPKQLLFVNGNKKMLDCIKMMCMFCGYGFSMTKRQDEYLVYVITGSVSPWSVRFIEKQLYSGYVYEINLFDGLVYVTEKNLPVWMSPK